MNKPGQFEFWDIRTSEGPLRILQLKVLEFRKYKSLDWISNLENQENVKNTKMLGRYDEGMCPLL